MFHPRCEGVNSSEILHSEKIQRRSSIFSTICGSWAKVYLRILRYTYLPYQVVKKGEKVRFESSHACARSAVWCVCVCVFLFFFVRFSLFMEIWVRTFCSIHFLILCTGSSPCVPHRLNMRTPPVYRVMDLPALSSRPL